MRRAARTDANHTEIIKAFRRLGFSVADTSKLGKGFPDCVIGKNLKDALIEIKDGSKPPSARALTTDERKFREDWKGRYFVVKDLDDVQTISHYWDADFCVIDEVLSRA